ETRRVERAKCARCGIAKTPDNTGRDSHLKDGLNSYCKTCKNQRGKESYNRNKEGINKLRAEKRHSNIEITRAYGKEWRAKNKEKVKETNRLRRLENPEKVRSEAAKSQHKNRGHRNDYKRKWRKENKEIIKMKMTMAQKVNAVIAANIRNCLYGRKSGRHWETIVGYTLENLMVRLEKQFKSGMTWGNYGKYGWHIDHQIPISAFNFETPDDLDFKRCWALSNLQPMWAKDNLLKGDKVLIPFQPALAISDNGGRRYAEISY
ncbi:hypothetical protein GW915_14315, partial [bacterium]|nr:hypothetical protein [bacterium]